MENCSISKLLFITIAILSLVCCNIVSPALSLNKTTWSSDIKTNTSYKYRAEKSELRDLKTQEKYDNPTLLGGINIPNGGTDIKINSNLSETFNFFAGDRLDLNGVIEGDIGISSDNDYNLIFLPLTFNGNDFFQQLFDNKSLLEDLTNATVISTKFTGQQALALLNVNDYLNVSYTWDHTTGILIEKKVVALSGKMLLVVRGEGLGSGLGPGYELFEVIPIFLCLIIIKKLNKREKNK